MTTAQVIGIAAAVQAASAGLIAIFTIRLVRWTRALSNFTEDYVEEMRRSNDLLAEGNRITASMVAVTQGQAQPRLVVNQRGRRANEDWVWAPLEVSNYGGGPAEAVVVVSDWGEGEVRGIVPSGGKGTTKVGLRRPEWEGREKGPQKDPTLQRIRYKDSTGTPHDEAIQ